MENVEQKAKDWIEDAAQQKIIKSIPQSEFKSDSFEIIGVGRFGSVYKAYWKKPHRYVACKKLTVLSADIQRKTWESLKHELGMQIRVHNCENIIRILGISKGKFQI